MNMAERYINSEECKKYCTDYLKGYLYLSDIFLENRDDFMGKYNQAVERSNQIEYSTGGETILFGYYSPSPVYDMVISGASRGRIAKKSSKRLTYEYYFVDDKLVAINKLCEHGMTDKYLLLRHNDDEKIYISVDKYLIGNLTICYYKNNRLSTYIHSVHLEDGSIPSMYIEEYQYDANGRLCNAEHSDVTIGGRYKIVRHFYYSFLFDEEGYATHYRYDLYYGDFCIYKSDDNDFLPTLVRRKI